MITKRVGVYLKSLSLIEDIRYEEDIIRKIIVDN